jgi:hypothetical protein
MSLNAGDFGVNGDGEQHNTLELMAIRDHIRNGPDRVWHVEFEPGHYCWGDERWALFGNRTVILEFNHSTVESLSRPLLPLGAGPLSWGSEYPAAPAVNPIVGHLIETAAVGAAEARLEARAPGYYLPGDAVLVAGYIQQFSADGTKGWGWPPNFRFFEWKTVAEMPDETTVRFVDPFRFGYDASWPDFDHGSDPYGAPRLWRCRLDDGRHVNRSLTIRNANFIGGRNRPAGTRTALGLNGLHVRLENCSTSEDNDCWPTVAKRVDFIDCRLSRMEMDKIVERVSLDGCEVYGDLTSGGAGVLDVRIEDTNVYGLVRATPRRSWVFDECHAYHGVMMSKGLTDTPFALTGAASAV